MVYGPWLSTTLRLCRLGAILIALLLQNCAFPPPRAHNSAGTQMFSKFLLKEKKMDDCLFLKKSLRLNALAGQGLAKPPVRQ
jgi:hypothetical protein